MTRWAQILGKPAILVDFADLPFTKDVSVLLNLKLTHTVDELASDIAEAVNQADTGSAPNANTTNDATDRILDLALLP
jgi:hypothetical protein